MTHEVSREELLRRLREIEAGDSDHEQAHIAADNLLLAYIDDDEVTQVFKAINRWYG